MIRKWYKNLESVAKGMLFINIIWVLMFVCTLLIFDYATNAFENDLQYREVGLNLLKTLRSNFAFVWAMGFPLIGLVDFCIIMLWLRDKVIKNPEAV